MELSSSKPCPLFKHAVFLSFRGEDTRNNFTDHLYKALRDKGVQTFIDYNLERGDEISPSLQRAIEESYISLIIFSKNYASSRWCLQELVKILECKNRETNKQIVIPIFYGVTPSDVRNQNGSYVDAFVKHGQHFKDEVQRWRDALKEAADLSGWPLSSNEREAERIEAIVQHVLMRLNGLSSNDTSNLVAIDSQVEKIKLWLCNGVRRVGICGIGGIGKTTLTKAIFSNISHQFEGSYFFDCIREQCNQSKGLNAMQQELLSAILGDGNVNIGTFTTRCTFIKNVLREKKLLIVLDDVSDFSQLEYLIEYFDCLNPQSRIIITTRDKQVLSNCKVDKAYEVPELNYQEALKLFCKHAFKGNHPKVDYVEISGEVIQCIGGVPLALKILGSFLFDKEKSIWKSAMNKLEKIPDKKIHEVLKISYDGLDDEVQQIFLDIAIFFKNCDVRIVKSFLDACGFEAGVGISVLVDKFLIAISNSIITTHDLLQMMAKEIIRQESIKFPERRSRLWNHEEICRVLTKNMGTEMIEGISLDMSKIRDISLNPDAFVKMRRLRFLEFKMPHYEERRFGFLKFKQPSCYEETRNKVQVPQGLECDFSELRYLHWHACPLESLPPSTRLENLVILVMSGNKLERLWSGVLHLEKLKEIDLCCPNLTIFPDLSGSPNLETLTLIFCIYLREIPPSIQCLNKLRTVCLFYCTRLSSIPNCSDLNSLRSLQLSGCSSLELLPEMPCNIKQLILEGTAIEELPSSMKDLSRLVRLDLSHCKRLKSLPNGIFKWRSLTTLELKRCCKLGELPNDIGASDSLTCLKADGAAIRELPSSVTALKNFEGLDFQTTQVKDKVHWELLPHVVDWPNWIRLDLSSSGIMKLPDNLGYLSSLGKLYLPGNSFESIPESIINLSRLWCLNVSNCQRLQYLPMLPFEVGFLDAHGCTSLQGFAKDAAEPLSKMHITSSISQGVADFRDCSKLDGNVLEAIFRNAILKRNEFDKEGLGFQLFYPGSQIPYWFDFQEMGSSVKVELPLDWMTMDLAFCVVVAPLPDHQKRLAGLGACLIVWDCQLKSEHVMGGYFVKSTQERRKPYSTFDYLKSNHVFLNTYYMDTSENDVFKEKLCQQGLSQTEIHDFYFHFKIKDNIKYEKIIKCGVHLISLNRHQNLGPDYFGGVRQRIEARDKCLEEDEPHSKRLKSLDVFSELPTNQVHDNCEEQDEAQPNRL